LTNKHLQGLNITLKAGNVLQLYIKMPVIRLVIQVQLIRHIKIVIISTKIGKLIN